MLRIFFRSAWSKAILHAALLTPLIEICYQIFLLTQGENNRFGPDPGKVILEDLATIGIWILLLSLLLTPLKKIFKLSTLLRFSRMIGLYAFFYIFLHLLSYLAFILAWDFSTFLDDIIKRPYMIVGAIALVILCIMAATSYKAAVRRLGRNWKKLHKLVYIAAILAIVHEWWQAKEAINEPLLHGTILAILLGYRLFYYFKNKKAYRLRPS